VLLEAGADPNTADLFGFTPLHIAGAAAFASLQACIAYVLFNTLAASESHAAVVDLLMRFGASPLSKDRVPPLAPFLSLAQLHTSHVTRHTSHATRHTSYVICCPHKHAKVGRTPSQWASEPTIRSRTPPLLQPQNFNYSHQELLARQVCSAMS
jgi:hypothetical protein